MSIIDSNHFFPPQNNEEADKSNTKENKGDVDDADKENISENNERESSEQDSSEKEDLPTTEL